MHLTQEKKAQIAEFLRRPSNLPFYGPDDYLDRMNLVSKETLHVPTSVGDSVCYLFRAKDRTANDLLYINIHGGGFVQPHSVWDEALCATFALEMDCTVLDVDYRLAPEFPYPTAAIECYEVAQWAIAHAAELGADPRKVVLGGNSAGATLTADACIMAEERQGRVPAMAVMIYPAAEQLSNPEVHLEDGDFENIDLGDLRNRGTLYNLLYTGDDPQALTSPYVQLNTATEKQLSRFPETLIITAGKDPLRFGGEKFAGMVASSGSRVTVKRYLESGHGFIVRCIGPEWRQARALIMDTVCTKFGIRQTHCVE